MTAKEKLKAARETLDCGPGCMSGKPPFEFMVHDWTMSALLEGLSVHEVTMAEIELDEEATT